VRDVVRELSAGQPQRPLTLKLGDLPETVADMSLLRQLFINLLSNAFKFTRHTDPAEIEIGSESNGDERAYFVRDNGSGFDMARADRLFDAFQRFHRAEQFEGSGVGLSIVKRIVQRHGGRIWAESAPGRGATFRFTLGGAQADAPGHG